MILPVSNPIINSIAASAADLSLIARVFNATVDSDGDAFIPMEYPSIISTGGILKSLSESVYVATVTYTAASNTEYKFKVTQIINDVPMELLVTYTSDGTATDAEIAAALIAQVNNSNLNITATGAASPITLTADAGYPLFYITAVENVTVADGMATYAPNATEADAITNVIAPHATAGTAIAGTDTVTVTTAAAHLLVPGDVVTLASVATMVLIYEDANGKVHTAASGGQFRVATVPSSVTFTLEGVRASGTNSGAITITANNCCFVQTASAQATITAGKQLSIAGVATATLDGGTSGTYRVGAVLTGDQRFKLEKAVLVGTNSGTITITLKESASRGLGTDLVAAGIDGASTSNNYSQCSFTFSKAGTAESNFGQVRGTELKQVLWFNEGDADYAAFFLTLTNILNGELYAFPVIGNPNAIAVA